MCSSCTSNSLGDLIYFYPFIEPSLHFPTFTQSPELIHFGIMTSSLRLNSVEVNTLRSSFPRGDEKITDNIFTCNVSIDPPGLVALHLQKKNQFVHGKIQITWGSRCIQLFVLTSICKFDTKCTGNKIFKARVQVEGAHRSL